MTHMGVQEAADLIRLEYAEMPSLPLTFRQAQRLLSLSEDQCNRALTLLVQSGFLVRTAAGAYAGPSVACNGGPGFRDRSSLSADLQNPGTFDARRQVPILLEPYALAAARMASISSRLGPYNPGG